MARLRALLLLLIALCWHSVRRSRSFPLHRKSNFESLAVPDGGKSGFTIPNGPNLGPPEDDPQITFRLQITDRAKRPITARIVSAYRQVTCWNVSEYRITLPGHLTDRMPTVRIEADGFEPSEVGFRFNSSTVVGSLCPSYC